jgi:ribosomal protein L21E
MKNKVIKILVAVILLGVIILNPLITPAKAASIIDTFLLTDITFDYEQVELTMVINGSGSVTPGVGVQEYEPGTMVNITATPAVGWQFAEWTGNVTTVANVFSNNTSIIMAGDYEVTAHFLFVTDGEGGVVEEAAPVRVTNLHGHISDEGILWDTFEAKSLDDKLLLNIPAGTIAKDSSDDALMIIYITQIKNPYVPEVGAVIAGNAYEVAPSGATFEPPVALSIKYDASLIPDSASENDVFIATWDKVTKTWITLESFVDTTTDTATANISHFSDYIVLVQVDPYTYEHASLTIATLGKGTVTPGKGTHTYYLGTVVPIKAKASQNWRFLYWTGDTDTIGNTNSGSTNITMSSNCTIRANFIRFRCTLKTEVNGSGTVTHRSISNSYYTPGSTVNITATPAAGWRFVNWTGDVRTIGDVNSAGTNITMNDDYTITANFIGLESIAISPDNPMVTIGPDQTFTAIGTYSDNTTVDLTDFVLWSSNDTSKAEFYLDKSDIGDITIADDNKTVYSIDTENDRIYKSEDAGATWNEMVKPPFIDELQLIKAFPYDENTIAVLGDENKIGVYLPSSESWQDISDTGGLSPAVLYDIDVSQPKSGINYIAAAGKSAIGPGLYYYNWGAATREWKDAASDASWTGLDPGRDAFNAVAFSPNFESDYIAVALSSKASGGDDALLLHAFSFYSLSWEPFTNWQQPDDYPVIVDTASGNFTVNKASLTLLPDYDGADESLRIVFAGYAGTDDTGETGGIFLMLDTIKKELTSTPAAINSIAADGTNLVAGSYDTNLVYRTTQPLDLTPVLLSTAIGSPGLNRIKVGYCGNYDVLAGTTGEGSFLAFSSNNGETFFPRGFTENSNTVQTMATGQVTITAQYGPLVDTTVLTITDPTKAVLTMAVSGSGSVTPGAGPHEYDKGTTVNITANPAAGWKFVEWCGDVTKIADPHSNNTTVIVYNDCVVTAVFALDSAMEWSYTYGGTEGDEGYSVCPVRDGGFAIAGYTTSFGTGGPDVYLIKTDVSGNGTWYQTFNGGQGYSIRQTTDDGFVITGYKSTGEPGWYDVWLIKTDTYGHELWSKTYGGDSADIGQSVCQTTDGGYILAGYTSSYGSGLYDAWLIKTDSSGNMTWSKTFGFRP